MKFYGKAEKVANEVLSAFEQGAVPAALAQVFIHRKDNRPVNSWSWSNQMLVALYGHSDARGYKQWQEVDRYVKKGEKAFHILIPCIKKTETENERGETVEDARLYGFKSAAVFGYEQTEGAELEVDKEAEKWIERLPLIEVAESWGLKVNTYNGKGARALGFYKHGKSIGLGVENLSTWAHELIHAADDRTGNIKKYAGQVSSNELVAELGGSVLLKCLGYDVEADLGGCMDYIKGYYKNPIAAAQKLLNRTCQAVDLVLTTAEAMKQSREAA